MTPAPEPSFGWRYELTDQDFQSVCNLSYSQLGIRLTENKRALVAARLGKILNSSGFTTFREYLESLRQDASGTSLEGFVNRITTNHTYFYREPSHFDFLMERALPELTAGLRGSRDPDLRVWSAGCSSGEEAYMLAILMMEALGPEYPRWQAGVLATDISSDALGIAREGLYGPENVDHLPRPIVERYFRRAAGGRWRVAERVREQVVFRKFNLMTRVYPFRRPFHIIFCRNVMIYFDRRSREALVEHFYANTAPGGYLFIGLSETIRELDNAYRYVMPGVYRK